MMMIIIYIIIKFIYNNDSVESDETDDESDETDNDVSYLTIE